MAIDTKRMNSKREKVKSGSGSGDFFTPDEGEYKMFVHGQVYPDDDHELTKGFNFVEIVQHYGRIGGKKAGQMCLDPKLNPVLTHKAVVKFIADKKKDNFKVSKKQVCPVDEAIEEGEIKGKKADQQQGQVCWIFGVTPMFYRKTKSDEWKKLKFEPRVWITRVTIFKGITGEMIDLDPNDITDPKAAVLLKITRTGKELDTEYEVKTDIDTARKPLCLDKAQRKTLAEAMKPGGACDLLKVAANLTKSPTVLKALMAGIQPAEEEEEEEVDDGKKDCFGNEYTDDEECAACPDAKECETITGTGNDETEEEETEEEETEEEETEEPEEEEPEEEEPEEPEEEETEETEEEAECWGKYEKGDEGCDECPDAEKCAEVTPDPAEDETEEEETEEEETEEEETEEEETEDPDLEAIEREAAEVASRRRPTRAARTAAAKTKKDKGKKKDDSKGKGKSKSKSKGKGKK